MTVHLVIPDTQVKPGVPTDHLGWIGEYILDRKPDRVIHLGDHWDMESLSQWSSELEQEGKRYKADVAVGNEALKLITGPAFEYNQQQRETGHHGRQIVRGGFHFCVGNHEDRIRRWVEKYPRLDGFMGFDDLDLDGWDVHPFLQPVNLDGVRYAHYWYNPMSGKPYGGSAANRLQKVGHSFVMGHQQTLDVAVRFVDGQQQWAIVAGACYLHDEGYRGPQANAHWRGIAVLHEVADGEFDPMFVSLDYLCRKYEGVPLRQWMNEHHPEHPYGWSGTPQRLPAA